ncbi:spermatid perinuclear RNA-binding protein-like [Salvelinus sp. IW2-2015]|uniref:spermatid perinuclear RNA-binding protein-like n=1 Tax=Salvelinus sp. IW2-2015 TaxID=2691554 RepID=UPI0038D41D1A
MNALMRLNQVHPGLQYKLLSQSARSTLQFLPCLWTYRALSMRPLALLKTAKLKVALKVLQALGYPAGFEVDLDSLSADERSDGEGRNHRSERNDRMSTSSRSNSVTSTDTAR